MGMKWMKPPVRKMRQGRGARVGGGGAGCGNQVTTITVINVDRVLLYQNLF